MRSSSAVVEVPQSSARRSRMVIGTAGIGMAYGLPQGRDAATLMPEMDALALLRAALGAGVGAFDTAPAYGCSEERIGLALGSAGQVWTKFESQDDDALLDRSLQRLRRSRIEMLQWHNWSKELLDDPGCRERAERLRRDPRVQALGATTYGCENALAAVTSGWFSQVQVEWNLLNQEVVDAIADAARRNGVHISVRSVLLQGVLTDRGEDLPAHLAALRPARARAADLARDHGIRLDEFALRAAFDHPAIAHVLVGIDRPEQLTTALAATDAKPLPRDAWPALHGLHAANAPTDPRRWKPAHA